MTTFALKMIALVCMMIDHIGAYIPDTPVQMRWIGRIAAPLFVFCLCEGIDHTSNEKKYLLRLYAGSLLMAFIQSTTGVRANIFRTLFAIAFNLIMIKHIRNGEKKYLKYYLWYILWQIVSCWFFGYFYMRDHSDLIRRLYPALTGSIAFCEYGLPLILLGIVIYLTKNDKKKLAIGYIAFCALYALLSLTNITTVITAPFISASRDPERMNRWIQYGFFTILSAFRPGTTGKNPFTEGYQWMMIASMIPMLMYNGKKGRSMKWFFYVFYVVHLIILWYIGSSMQ
ncbi:MAG: TraX family protein [Erysipelotrichaceae bacterium]|nr:TraX family protein [Erysipelotrichaceae bacterium]